MLGISSPSMGDSKHVGFVTAEDLRSLGAGWHENLRRSIHEDMQKMLVDLQTSLLEKLAPARNTPPTRATSKLARRLPNGATVSALNGNANEPLRNAAVQDKDDGGALAIAVDVKAGATPIQSGSQISGSGADGKSKAMCKEVDKLVDLQKMLVDLQTSLLEQLAPARYPENAHGSIQSAPNVRVNELLRKGAERNEDDSGAFETPVKDRLCGYLNPPPFELPGAVVHREMHASNTTSNEDYNTKRHLQRQISVQSQDASTASTKISVDAWRQESRASQSDASESPPPVSERRPSRPKLTRSTSTRGSGEDLDEREKKTVMSAGRHSHRGGLVEQKTGIFCEPTSLQSTLLRKINHPWFEYLTAALILLNGVLIGVQSDYVARNNLEDPPASFEVLEIVFCVLFTAELGVRLFCYRKAFFSMTGWQWNWFDFLIVLLQLTEIGLKILSSGLDFNFNVLRILRLVRIVRLARVLRLIGELKTIVQSIGNSMKPLFWTAVLLFMIVYVLGIFLTQAVHTKRISLAEEKKEFPESLTMYWGDLISSILTLFQSITGGIDWDTVCRPLMDHVGPEMGLVFCGYILFTVLAMLNVVTGVFIDSVMTYATDEKEKRQIAHVKNLFSKLDIDQSGEITWDEFQEQLQYKPMRNFFKTIDVDIEKAKGLFELLDLDDSGSVDVSEFMDGCLRIWAPPKGLDLRMILRDVNKVVCMVKDMKKHKIFHENDSESESEHPHRSPCLGSMERPSFE